MRDLVKLTHACSGRLLRQQEKRTPAIPRRSPAPASATSCLPSPEAARRRLPAAKAHYQAHLALDLHLASSQQQQRTTRLFTLPGPNASSTPLGASCPGSHADAHCLMFITKLNYLIYLTKLLIQNCMFLNSEYSNFVNLGLVKIARSD